MSSAEDEPHDAEQGTTLIHNKKRRVQRACDVCRRKKIRCDGAQMPSTRCSNCIAYNYDCTYMEAAKKRGPPKGYVETLEMRLEKMEGLLSRLCPDADFSKELGMTIDKSKWFPELARHGSGSTSQILSSRNGGGASPSSMTDPGAVASPPSAPNDDELESSDGEFMGQSALLSESMKNMHLHPMLQKRFLGKSSGAKLVMAAIDLKSEYSMKDIDLHTIMGTKRPEFWTVLPWERSCMDTRHPRLEFPDPDLLTSLIDIYFEHVNPFSGLLHAPSFRRSIEDGLHLRDDGFGQVTLMLCAIAARYSDDPRVLLDGGHDQSLHSAGWKWFSQVEVTRRSLLTPPCLYDLQIYCLAILFLQGSSVQHVCWTMTGVGIRIAQDVGAHRRKVYNTKPTAEDELWKRAFWYLVTQDRMMSSGMGRPCAIQEEDFDLDLPIVCDDEYWDDPDPEKAFKQPPGKPSNMDFIISLLKLVQIMAFALRTIYAINKSKVLLGFVGSEWEQHIVAELDSALNKWIDSIPEHLHWDPSREDPTFFRQSAVLYCTYYHVQILVHRPFIPSPRKPSPLSFPSLAICTNAARSCSHVVEVGLRRNLPMPVGYFQVPAFVAGIVLLLSIWGVKRSGVSIDPEKEMQDVHKCMQALKVAEKRWHAAGRLWDILFELASLGDLPLPAPSPGSSATKRPRDSDSPAPSLFQQQTSPSVLSPLSPHFKSTTASSGSETPVASDSGHGTSSRQYAGSKRVPKSHRQGESSSSRSSSVGPGIQPIPPPNVYHRPQQRTPPPQHQAPSSTSGTTSGFPYATLPMHSDELRRVPAGMNTAYAGFARPSIDPITGNWSLPGTPTHPAANVGRPSPRTDDSGDGSVSLLNGRSFTYPFGFGPPPSGSAGANGPMLSQEATEMALRGGFTDFGGSVNGGGGGAGNSAGFFGSGASNMFGFDSPMSDEHRQGGQGAQSMMSITDAGTGAGAGGYGDLMQGLVGGSGHGGMGGSGAGQTPSRVGSGQETAQAELEDMMKMWSSMPAGFELEDWDTYMTNISGMSQFPMQGTSADTGPSPQS